MSWPMPCSIFRVYSTYTAQLSSKRKGMEAEGKTWNYHDILAQFITMHGGADVFLDGQAASPRLLRYCTGLIQSSDFLILVSL